MDLELDLIQKRYSLAVNMSNATNTDTFGYVEYKVANICGNKMYLMSPFFSSNVANEDYFYLIHDDQLSQVIFSSWSREGRIATIVEPIKGLVTPDFAEWIDLFPGFLYKIEIFPRLKRTGSYLTVPKYTFMKFRKLMT